MQADLPTDYLVLAVFLALAFAVSCGAAALSFLLARQKPSSAKNEPYECGFLPSSDARARFNVKFYLVAILFIIFDLELVFLFPWAVSLHESGWEGFVSMTVFLLILSAGFVYEWKKGALEWA